MHIYAVTSSETFYNENTMHLELIALFFILIILKVSQDHQNLEW